MVTKHSIITLFCLRVLNLNSLSAKSQYFSPNYCHLKNELHITFPKDMNHIINIIKL